MPKYEEYPFYNFLVDTVSKPGNKVINAVKDKLGFVVDYDKASDLVTYNPNEYSYDVNISAIRADNLMDYIDIFKDNVDAINDYINKWDEYISKIKVSAMGCSTFLVMNSDQFVDGEDFINFKSRINKHDKLAINTNLPDQTFYDPDNLPFLMVVRLGETNSEFYKSDYPTFTKLLQLSGLDFGAINDFDSENKIISESGDIDIIINADRPGYDDEDSEENLF